MKWRELIYLLGFRPKLRTYGCEIRTASLPVDGEIEYAQWLHPRTRDNPCPFNHEIVTELRRFIRPGDFALDIGAHTGDSTIPIALAAGAGGCVLALEPNPHVFPVLSKTAGLNRDKTNIMPLNFAATRADGDIVFEYSDPGFCNGGRHEGINRWRHSHAFPLTVRGRNLRGYLRANHNDLLPRLHYIKVDAEGYDLAILQTLDDLIAERTPYIKAEVFKHTDRARRMELLGFLHRHGYAVHHIESESRYLGEPVGAGNVMRWPHFDVFCVPNAPVRKSDHQTPQTKP
jgi:FkbM family methyltransferase